MTRRVFLLAIIAWCTGCGRGPRATRVGLGANDRIYPRGVVHFVERGQRARGVLATATPGSPSAFSTTFTTVIVPLRPTVLDGPAWTGGRVSDQRAARMAGLPEYRHADTRAMYGDSGRFRFRAPAAWVLATEPLVLGLPAGAPVRTSQEYALAGTGVTEAEAVVPLGPWVTRLVVDDELAQLIDRLVVHPAQYWQLALGREGVEVTRIMLAAPMSIDAALDALAGGDSNRLGEAVPLLEHLASEREHALARRADRRRLTYAHRGLPPPVEP